MKHLARVCAASLLAILPTCPAQSAHHASKAPPKPEPTLQDLFDYVHGALLAYSPDDGVNDNLEVSLDANSKTLTVKLPDGHCDAVLSNLDASNVVWDTFDPSDSTQSREKLLRLTVVSVSGKPARACYDSQNHLEANFLANRVRLLFSLSRTDEDPDFQKKMTKAIKKLISLSGGLPEKNLF